LLILLNSVCALVCSWWQVYSQRHAVVQYSFCNSCNRLGTIDFFEEPGYMQRWGMKRIVAIVTLRRGAVSA
jgi:hypothetical protein